MATRVLGSELTNRPNPPPPPPGPRPGATRQIPPIELGQRSGVFDLDPSRVLELTISPMNSRMMDPSGVVAALDSLKWDS